MNNDAELLKQYLDEGSESAFEELVSRYVDMVYSIALRHVNRDEALAKDICQIVFLHLVQKADKLPQGILLGGWLHRDTCFVAAQSIRTENRRRAREQEAVQLNTNDDEFIWEKLESSLDDAIRSLPEIERQAIILRYFQHHSLHTVGETLGTSEDAARMRIVRALEKLKTFFKKRGLDCTTTVLASLLTTKAVQAAPVGLANALASSALSNFTTGIPASNFFAQINTMAKIKTVLLGSAVVIGLTLPAIHLFQSNQAMKERISSLEKSQEDANLLRIENKRLKDSLVDSNELNRLRNDQIAYFKLRRESEKTNQKLKDLKSSLARTQNVPEDQISAMEGNISKVKTRCTLSPNETLSMRLPATDHDNGREMFLFLTPSVNQGDSTRISYTTKWAYAPSEFWSNHGFKQDSDENVPSLSNLQASEILKELESDKEAQIYTGNIIEMQGKTAHISIGQVPIGTGHQQKPITVEHALDIQGNITEGGFDLNLVIERKTFAPEKIAD